MFHFIAKPVILTLSLLVAEYQPYKGGEQHSGMCGFEGRPLENCYERVEACHYRKVVCDLSRSQFSRKQVMCRFEHTREGTAAVCPTRTIDDE